MSLHEEENKVKLHILQSLARSQRALARILESIAEVVQVSDATAQQLAGHIDAFSRYQREIALKFIGVRSIRESAAALSNRRPTEQRYAILPEKSRFVLSVSNIRSIRRMRRGVPGKPWLSRTYTRSVPSRVRRMTASRSKRRKLT